MRSNTHLHTHTRKQNHTQNIFFLTYKSILYRAIVGLIHFRLYLVENLDLSNIK